MRTRFKTKAILYLWGVTRRCSCFNKHTGHGNWHGSGILESCSEDAASMRLNSDRTIGRVLSTGGLRPRIRCSNCGMISQVNTSRRNPWPHVNAMMHCPGALIWSMSNAPITNASLRSASRSKLLRNNGRPSMEGQGEMCIAQKLGSSSYLIIEARNSSIVGRCIWAQNLRAWRSACSLITRSNSSVSRSSASSLHAANAATAVGSSRAHSSSASKRMQPKRATSSCDRRSSIM